MTDQLMDNLTNEEHEALLLMSEHAIAPPLLPAAQAVLDAFLAAPICAEVKLAAALRAVADQVVPDDPQEAMYFTTEAIRLNKQAIRRQFLAIAAELDGGAQ